jgi:hypothetical protein
MLAIRGDRLVARRRSSIALAVVKPADHAAVLLGGGNPVLEGDDVVRLTLRPFDVAVDGHIPDPVARGPGVSLR